MRDQGPKSTIAEFSKLSFNRLKWVRGGGFVLFGLIFVRAIVIHLNPPSSKSLANIADRQYQKPNTLSPYRGTIYDRRGIPLAMSVRLPSLAVNPRIFRPTQDQVALLARHLKLSPKKILDKSKSQGYFAWLKRKVPVDTAKKIVDAQIAGLNSIQEPSRFYPEGTSGAHLLGYVGIDDHGLQGLEQQFEAVLRGNPESGSMSVDARGRPIFYTPDRAAPEKSGHDIVLTIDRAIQQIADTALKKGVLTAQAKSGYAIVSNPHSGKILAIANYPDFDPNFLSRGNSAQTRNFALLDLVEPGSVVKPFVVAMALEKKLTAPSEQHNCENGVYNFSGGVIHDDHPKKILTTSEVVIHSSNICTFKLAMKIGAESVFNTFHNFGLVSPEISLGYPGELHGRLSNWKNWKAIRFANVSFGQGFLTNALSIVQAYGAIANGGKLLHPVLVEKIKEGETEVTPEKAINNTIRRAVSPEVARSLREMLQRVVLEGTASKAAMSNYTSGGKTGTAQKVDSKTRTYSLTKRIASFVGMAPALDPELVIYVVVDEPGRQPYYGGLWAAPIFSEIASASLQYLNVPPDKSPNIAASTLPAAKEIR